MTLRHERGLKAVAWSPDGRYLATAGDAGVVKVRKALPGRELLTLQGHTGKVDRLAFSPDSRKLASAGVDKTLRIWDLDDGREICALDGVTGDQSWSPDGKRHAMGRMARSESGTRPNGRCCSNCTIRAVVSRRQRSGMGVAWPQAAKREP